MIGVITRTALELLEARANEATSIQGAEFVAVDPGELLSMIEAIRESDAVLAVAVRVSVNDKFMAGTLTATQARCTELLEENRKLKAELKAMEGL